MFGLRLIFWFMMVTFVLVLFTALGNSLSKNKDVAERFTDFVIGAVVFVFMLVTVKVFGGFVI